VCHEALRGLRGRALKGGGYRSLKLPRGDHSALGDALATLRLIEQMAAARELVGHASLLPSGDPLALGHVHPASPATARAHPHPPTRASYRPATRFSAGVAFSHAPELLEQLKLANPQA
jgi:hypothetical protein